MHPTAPAVLFLLASSLSAPPAPPAGSAAPTAVHAALPGTPNATADPTSARMKAVLDTVQPAAIHADVVFLAGDELGGRDTPSAGLEVAARFLRARLERLGWKPGAPEGYFYTYPLEVRRALDEEACALTWKAKGQKGAPRAWKLGADYFLTSTRDAADVDLAADVVFAARGTRDDFKAVRAEGKWALVLDAGDDVRDLASNARRAKAAGLLVAPAPDYAGEPYAKRFAGALETVRRGQVAPAPKDKKRPSAEDRPARDVFPVLALAPEAGAALLAEARKPGQPARGELLGVEVAEARRVREDGDIEVENVCGFWPGSDPALAKQVILLTAHYDHVGTHNGVVYNGADDNGSGTSTLLAVAEALAQHGPLRRSVLVMWVSGEEKGLWGSNAWRTNPWLPEGCKPIADINIDMVGRNAPDKLLVTPTRARAKDYNGLVKLAERLAPLEGFPELGSADEYYTRSDHYEFAQLGIPVMFLFSDIHEDYHKPGDDAEKLDYDKIRRVARLVLRVLDELQDDKLDL